MRPQVGPPETDPPAIFVVHGLDQLRAALAAGAEAGRRIVAVSAPGASAYTGALWFLAMTGAGHAELPDVPLTAILDCGDRAGDAQTALEAGAGTVIFTGHPAAAARLADIASRIGAVLLDRRPEACDLGMVPDPARAARVHCNSFAGA
jgi:hypothetical protein